MRVSTVWTLMYSCCYSISKMEDALFALICSQRIARVQNHILIMITEQGGRADFCAHGATKPKGISRAYQEIL